MSIETDITELRTKIADLQARLAALTVKHQRDVTALMACDDVLDKHRKAMLAELTDAFERIAHIEFTLFPDLPRDIRHLNTVIGDRDTKAYNSLDFRDPQKKSR